ncbi:protein LURP-one-related 8-like [Canna indica]|uniref:Protein LURP-one-related 8-like n=1 Tax=Canna indica TaxID=4628 RepID=A0AAQ3QBQ8_9LILI|nr:protein LURP-one-related 8-like [Canna indica]
MHACTMYAFKNLQQLLYNKSFSKELKFLSSMEAYEVRKKTIEDWVHRIREARRSKLGRRGIFPELCSPTPVRLTVWCKSLLFNSHGYTVYDDSNGQMVFRVENYAHDWRQETVLMDCAGNVLLTIRRCSKIFNLTESWKAYKGDKDVERMVGEQRRPLFKAKKNLGSPSCTISMSTDQCGVAKPFGYWMNWSRDKEQLKIYGSSANTLVAEVSRKCGFSPKKLLDKDVLTLSMQPGMDQALAMAMVMITGSMRRYGP